MILCLLQLQVTVKSLKQQQQESASSSAAAEPVSTTTFDSRQDLSFLLQSLAFIPGIRVSKNCRFPLLIAQTAEESNDETSLWHWPPAAAFLEKHRHLHASLSESLSSLAASPSPPVVDLDRNFSDAAFRSQTQSVSLSGIAQNVNQADSGGRNHTMARGFPVSAVLESRSDSAQYLASSPLFSRFVSDAKPELADATLAVHKESIHRGFDVACREWSDVEEI
jgi:hypothetical protein